MRWAGRAAGRARGGVGAVGSVDPEGVLLPNYWWICWVTAPNCTLQVTDHDDGVLVAGPFATPPAPPGGWTTLIWLPVAERLLQPGGSSVGAGGSSAGTGGSSTGTGVCAGGPGGGSKWSELAAELASQVVPGLLLFLRRVRRLVVEVGGGGRGSGERGLRKLGSKKNPEKNLKP